MTFQHSRRLVAVVAADVVGYARLMEAHEEETHHELMRLRTNILEPQISAYRGRIIKNTGDGFLAIFDSALAATRCCVDIQRAVAHAGADRPSDQRILFRLGINVANAIIEEQDVYGDGVNIAARLQSYAEPGGIIVSAAVADQVGDTLDIPSLDLGDLHLKNITRPVRTYSLRLDAGSVRLTGKVHVEQEARPSIAVLPFRKSQVDESDAYFADGITEAIIHALAGLKDLFVISHSSTIGYNAADIDAPAVGRELGIRYVLHGSVRRAGGRVRIGTELSDTETRAIIRSDQYDGSLADLFELQDRISTQVVTTIAPQVREHELRRALRKHPDNMTGYDLVLQALNVLYRMDRESFARARSLLQQAISHDPGFAPAHSYTAYWYVLRVGEMGSPDPDADAAAAAHHALAAFERDANDPLALAMYGYVQSFFMRDYNGAALTLERAIDAGPNSAIAWTMSSANCGFMGDGRAAVERAERGVRLSPTDPHRFWHEGILAQAHYVNGDYEQALTWARRAVARNPSVRFTMRTLTATLAAIGHVDEAAQAAKQLLEVQPDFRLGPYERRCPFRGAALKQWIERLRAAGLPD